MAQEVIKDSNSEGVSEQELARARDVISQDLALKASAIQCALISEAAFCDGVGVLAKMLQIENRQVIIELLKRGDFGAGLQLSLSCSMSKDVD